ncbi:MAG: adenylosuccinate synthetase, partial [Patescibacteria group bacterium]
NGKRYDRMTDPDMMFKAKPIYETLKGWLAPTSTITDYDNLPPQAKNFLKRIEQLVGTPISIVSVGPERDATMLR